MPALSLLIGNKNYSSWSLRPWLLLKQTGLEFEEVRVAFDTPEFAPRVRAYSPRRARCRRCATARSRSGTRSRSAST